MCTYALRQRDLEQDNAGDLSTIEQCKWFEQWIRRSNKVDKHCKDNDLPPLHELGSEAVPSTAKEMRLIAFIEQ